MSLRIITTGGTFDKHYDPIAGALSFSRSHLDELCARARLSAPFSIEVLMLIDSLDMDATHRAAVLAACRAAPERQIVVIHGTDSMVETAAEIGAAALDKTVVVTGAMVPYEVAGSDAMFNLGFALGCAAHLGAGAWIAMNGVVHPCDRVRKNRELGVFEAL
jgi:L-asparaginase